MFFDRFLLKNTAIWGAYAKCGLGNAIQEDHWLLMYIGWGISCVLGSTGTCTEVWNVKNGCKKRNTNKQSLPLCLKKTRCYRRNIPQAAHPLIFPPHIPCSHIRAALPQEKSSTTKTHTVSAELSAYNTNTGWDSQEPTAQTNSLHLFLMRERDCVRKGKALCI